MKDGCIESGLDNDPALAVSGTGDGKAHSPATANDASSSPDAIGNCSEADDPGWYKGEPGFCS